MILNDVIMMATEQPRSRAYLQKMIENDMIPNYIIYLYDGEKRIYNSTKREKAFFNIEKSLYDLIIENKIGFTIIYSKDINSNEVLQEIKKRNEKYVIFSASGILKKEILNTNKKFLHIHPGVIPEYRGSTCFYYSMIKENKIGATALFLNDKIDQGDIIKAKEFQIPNNINIDDIFDPYIRSMLLVEVLKEYVEKTKFVSFSQNVEVGETYYVIHPILKHLAILDNNIENIGNVYWFIGLSGSGKSTLANKLYSYLKNKNRRVKLLDGDELRLKMGLNLGYSIEDRKKSFNICIYLAKLLAENGIDVVIAHIGAFEELRNKARIEIVNYNEIYVKCSIEECARRDTKGYYKKALAGKLENFIGFDIDFEEPAVSDLIIDTEREELEACWYRLKEYIK
ncbi:adenylyl-sulfate kinase [Clostridium neonatale]|uniref:adenylyl-sulfate kinase n=1 Tax=Clostridium neonatale TaxID=137838 RepID=UPI003D34763A